jgi:hypothetical protein
MCEDPKTGQIIVRPEGKCPPGTVERMARKTAADGMIFDRMFEDDAPSPSPSEKKRR